MYGFWLPLSCPQSISAASNSSKTIFTGIIFIAFLTTLIQLTINKKKEKKKKKKKDKY